MTAICTRLATSPTAVATTAGNCHAFENAMGVPPPGGGDEHVERGVERGHLVGAAVRGPELDAKLLDEVFELRALGAFAYENEPSSRELGKDPGGGADEQVDLFLCESRPTSRPAVGRRVGLGAGQGTECRMGEDRCRWGSDGRRLPDA